MGNRLKNEMQAITDAIAEEIANAREKNGALAITANELAREYGVHPNTVTAMLRSMGLEFDGYFWYRKNEK